jgi:hypothetical protein
VGCLARRTQHIALARHALERALASNPKHWLSLEALLEVRVIGHPIASAVADCPLPLRDSLARWCLRLVTGAVVYESVSSCSNSILVTRLRSPSSDSSPWIPVSRSRVRPVCLQNCAPSASGRVPFLRLLFLSLSHTHTHTHTHFVSRAVPPNCIKADSLKTGASCVLNLHCSNRSGRR